MKTTLNELKSFNILEKLWANYRERIRVEDLDAEINLRQILELHGVRAAFWALRTQRYENYYTILGEITKSVLPLIEEGRKKDKITRDTLDSIFKLDEIALAEDKPQESFPDPSDPSVIALAEFVLFTAENAAIIAGRDAYTKNIGVSKELAENAYQDAVKAQWNKNKEILMKYL